MSNNNSNNAPKTGLVEKWNALSKGGKFLVAIIILAVLGSIFGAIDGDSNDSTGSTPDVTLIPPVTLEREVPSASDIHVDLLVNESQCFGSAGGLVTVEPELSFAGTWNYDGRYRVTFTIYGDEGGPLVQSTILDSNGNYSISEVLVSTATCGRSLSASVTSVRPV